MAEISGGVNVYPQECEDLLITHPKVMDAAVFGVPNPDLGEAHEELAADPRARLMWLYRRSPWFDERWNRYPVAREPKPAG